jgi:multidrug efflux pump subunit AcrA (membrane-fusion protein)
MSNRTGAMFTIEQALAQQNISDRDIKESGPALGFTPKELKSQELIAIGEQKKQTTEQRREQAERERIYRHQEALLGKEQAQALEEARRKQEEREHTVLGLADKALKQAGQAGEQTQVRIARIPTPGSIYIPLVLLVLLFFILVTFNGHTRFQWIWLVLTGNAHITYPQNNTPASSTPTGPISGGPAIPAEFLAAPLPISTPHGGSGVYGDPFS